MHHNKHNGEILLIDNLTLKVVVPTDVSIQDQVVYQENLHPFTSAQTNFYKHDGSRFSWVANLLQS